MKAFLMYADQDFDCERPLPPQVKALTQDLELPTLFEAMSNGDAFLYDAAEHAILSGLRDPDAIRYRQDILKDCLNNAAIVRELYAIAIESKEKKRAHWLSIFNISPSSILSSAIAMLEMFAGLLARLKRIAAEQADQFESDGFTAFFEMIRRELDDDYFARVQDYLRDLKFRDGVLLSVELDRGNAGTKYTLRQPHDRNRHWVKRMFAQRSPTYTFSLPGQSR